jgi:hypothetical protein
MATSAIFKYANDISMNRSANSARSVTTGGYARTHRLGPSVMSFEADLPLLTEEQFREVENELFSIDDGIKFLNVNISSNNGNNIMQSTSVPLKAGETNIKLIAYSYSTTREITLTNLLPNTTDIFKVGDFLQFESFHKLYQIAKPLGSTDSIFTSSNTGTCKVRLSTPLLSSVGLPITSVGSTDRYYIVSGQDDVYQDGTMTIKLANGNTALDSKGNPLVINIPSTNQDAYQIVSYLENQIESASSTHILKTDGVIINLSVKAFPEDYGETLPNHVGYFEITWGLDYEGCSLEYTTPTGLDVVNYNPINLTGDEVATIITNGITIENAAGTYTAGDFINTLVDAPLLANTRKIESVTTVGTTTTINFITAQEGTILSLGTFSAADPARTETVHTNVPGTSGNALSTIGTFDISVNSVGEIYSVTENTPSVNVRAGDVITIDVADMDNNTAADFTFGIIDITHNGITDFTSTNYANKEIYKHLNEASSTSNKVLFELTNISPSSIYVSDVNIFMGPDVNMKLMLTNKPAVTIVPKDENKNLYKYDTFKFAEVL